MTTTALAMLHRAVEQLRHAVSEVRDAYGDTPAARRLANDLERLEIDAGELEASSPHPLAAAGLEAPEHVVVPDTPLDETMWRDADDEGVGGYHGRRP